MTVESLGKAFRAFQNSFESPSLQESLENSNVFLNIDSNSNSEGCHYSARASKTSMQPMALPSLRSPSICLSGLVLYPPSDIRIGKGEELKPPLGCAPTPPLSCRCNQSGWKKMKILAGILGILLIEWTRQLPGVDQCDSGGCSKESVSHLSMTYYGPAWITTLAARLSLRLSSPPTLSLSFPRILPPDADIFICIRAGNIDRLKDILIEGRGSAADVLAPYGISTLLLARLHGQIEVYNLLLSAGASRVPPANIDCPAVHMHRFWSNYFSQDYNISTSEILRDYLYQHSSPHAKAISGIGDITNSERLSFTRLHKSTLGLTCESLDKILHICSEDVDATDSLGRTALHLAAYRLNISAVRVLLAQGANPDIRDQYGKAALHIVAAVGSHSGTKALVLGGADLEVRDQFGSTPLHHASLMGHHLVVELLLDGGSNIEAPNYHLETPVRHAILGDHIKVVQIFHQRGAALTLEDKCGYAIQKAVWFNSHKVLRYLLDLHLRVDQRHQKRGTILHTLAELGDARTMEMFLEIQHFSLANVDPVEVNSRGLTAMHNLEFRSNVEELKEPFLKALKHVKLARQRYMGFSLVALDKSRISVEETNEVEPEEFFFDAHEY